MQLAEFRERLNNFKLTDTIIQSHLDGIKRAFERGETELMVSFLPKQLLQRRRPGNQQRGRTTDQQAERGRGGKAGRRARLADDPAVRNSSGLRILEGKPEARWLRFLRPHHQDQAGNGSGQCQCHVHVASLGSKTPATEITHMMKPATRGCD
jgi:hypothetical protein